MSEMSGEQNTVTTGATGHIHRWYDMDIQLSELVRSLRRSARKAKPCLPFC